MSKTLKYIVGIVVALLVIYFSVDIQKLDEYKALDKTETFDAEKYAANVWENELPKAFKSAVELTDLTDQLHKDPDHACSQHGKKLGISKTWYFLVKGEGIIRSIGDEAIVVQLKNGKQFRLATAFIFGNAVRESSGHVNIDDFINMTDFNNVSVALNKKVRDTIIPDLKRDAKTGANIEFAGAVEINEDQPNTSDLQVIPISVKFEMK